MKKIRYVLIETSWNVKIEEIPEDVQDKIVLIETSWNVKFGIAAAAVAVAAY